MDLKTAWIYLFNSLPNLAGQDFTADLPKEHKCAVDKAISIANLTGKLTMLLLTKKVYMCNIDTK